ncbi:restriction endonuclease [Pseudomonas syringae]|uniref:restriction endonuclease n=1 Tax=Pseudomonas syringae TaxID=317 RepID=UPI000E31B9A9|nr:restriction endonuclease [Pseudomonas syringae]
MIGAQYPSPQTTPLEFERQVRAMLDAMGHQVLEYRSKHQEVVQGSDGDYEIDVTVRFSAFGADFLVLIECKHQKSRVKRDMLQVLHGRVTSVGAHKGILFSTSGFQSGAIEYAKAHGLGTVQVVDGRSIYLTRSYQPEPIEPQALMGEPELAGWLTDGKHLSLVSPDYGEALAEFIFGDDGFVRIT